LPLRLAHNSRAADTTGSTSLRILILYANPVTASFGATLHREVVKTLRSRGHEIDDCDLYAERFDPVWPAAGFVDRQLS
jgi:putative NADPH-quinone reductase